MADFSNTSAGVDPKRVYVRGRCGTQRPSSVPTASGQSHRSTYTRRRDDDGQEATEAMAAGCTEKTALNQPSQHHRPGARGGRSMECLLYFTCHPRQPKHIFGPRLPHSPTKRPSGLVFQSRPTEVGACFNFPQRSRTRAEAGAVLSFQETMSEWECVFNFSRNDAGVDLKWVYVLTSRKTMSEGVCVLTFRNTSCRSRAEVGACWNFSKNMPGSSRSGSMF